MNIKKLVSIIAQKEGKKSQVKVGDIREIVGILSDMLFKELNEDNFSVDTLLALIKNGKRRSKKKA